MIVRHRPLGVMPLEVWDVVVDGVPLYRLPASDQAQGLASLVVQLRAGTALRERGQALPMLIIREVVVVGGGANPALAVAIDGARLGVGWQVAAAGGEHIARQQLQARLPLVVDVGQTSIKWSCADHHHRIDRPARVPLEQSVRDNMASGRVAAVDFIASVLSDACSQCAPDAVVLGLPCEVADDLEVAGCSYPWPAGDRTLIADVAAGLGVPMLVLNDAELAAVSVQVAGASCGSTLVLTIGLGVGAAYIR